MLFEAGIGNGFRRLARNFYKQEQRPLIINKETQAETK